MIAGLYPGDLAHADTDEYRSHRPPQSLWNVSCLVSRTISAKEGPGRRATLSLGSHSSNIATHQNAAAVSAAECWRR
jgi:hypothetical protein